MEVEQHAQDAVISLSDLPEAVLQHILGLLDAAELAVLCVQDTRLHELASQQELWQALALQRWPQAVAAQHGGDWQVLYRHRAHMPASFTTCVDHGHQLTAQAGMGAIRANSSSLPALASPAGSPAGSPLKPGGAGAGAGGGMGGMGGGNVYGFGQRPFASIPGMLFDQVMQMLFSLCLWQTRLGASPAAAYAGSRRNLFGASSAMHGAGMSSSGAAGPPSPALAAARATSAQRQQAALAAEMRLVRADMAWWLGCKPEAVFAFVRRTGDMLGEYDMWGSGFSAWPEALWRRSALQFLADLQLGLQAEVCPSVSERLGRELCRLDEVMRSVDAEASDLATRAPQGLPLKHWWYSLRGQLRAPVC